MKSTCFVFIILLITISCDSVPEKSKIKSISQDTLPIKVADTNAEPDSALVSGKEDEIMNRVFQLPEVTERAQYVEQQTNGERHLSLRIQPLTDDEKDYWVIAGEDNGTNVVTHFSFSVNPDNLEVRYYDVVNDTLISIDAWRKQSKESNK